MSARGAEYRPGAILAADTPFLESDAGEAKLSNYSPRIYDCADCSTPGAARMSVLLIGALRLAKFKRFNESVALLIAFAMDRFVCENPNTLSHFGTRFHSCVRLQWTDSVWRGIWN